MVSVLKKMLVIVVLKSWVMMMMSRKLKILEIIEFRKLRLLCWVTLMRFCCFCVFVDLNLLLVVAVVFDLIGIFGGIIGVGGSVSCELDLFVMSGVESSVMVLVMLVF